MRLRVMAVGKLKDKELSGLAESYIKRSRPLLPIESLPQRSMEALRKSAGPLRVLLDERGELPSSQTFAGWLKGWREQGARSIDFMIGDADGFNSRDRADATRVLALSRLTLPHRIAQIVLIEQLYRAGTILAGHPYHRK